MSANRSWYVAASNRVDDHIDTHMAEPLDHEKRAAAPPATAAANRPDGDAKSLNQAPPRWTSAGRDPMSERCVRL